MKMCACVFERERERERERESHSICLGVASMNFMQHLGYIDNFLVGKLHAEVGSQKAKNPNL